MSNNLLVALRSVSRRENFAQTGAVDDVTLDIRNGEHTLFLGRAGSGKSALLQLIAGTIRPNSGHITWHTKPSRIAFAPRQPTIPTHMKVSEYLRLALHRTTDISYRLERCVVSLQLAPLFNVRCEALTPVQARRVSLAFAFLTDAPVTLLDRPFHELEPLIRPMARRFITWSLSDPERYTLISTSEHLKDLSGPFRRVVVMHGGKVVRDLSATQLLTLCRQQVVIMPSRISPDDVRHFLSERGLSADTAHIVQGTVGDVPATIAGPFLADEAVGRDVRRIDLPILLELWLRPPLESFRLRRMSSARSDDESVTSSPIKGGGKA